MSLRDYLDSYHRAIGKIDDHGFAESIAIKEEIRPAKQAVTSAKIDLVDGSVLQIRVYIDARIKLGLQDKLYLGNLEAKRDWGFAGDYVEAMWLMLQQDRPDDYVIATGETHAVKEFAAKVFDKLCLDYERYVAVDPRYFRPTEVDALLGDADKARHALDWQPKVSFEQLIDMMIAADLEIAQKEKTLTDAGYVGGNNRMI